MLLTWASSLTSGARFVKIIPTSASPFSNASRAASGVGGGGDSRNIENRDVILQDIIEKLFNNYMQMKPQNK